MVKKEKVSSWREKIKINYVGKNLKICLKKDRNVYGNRKAENKDRYRKWKFRPWQGNCFKNTKSVKTVCRPCVGFAFNFCSMEDWILPL